MQSATDSGTSPLQAIPEPPRHPYWRPCLRARWLLGVLGAALALPGLMVAVIFTAVGIEIVPLTDDVLDAEAAITSNAEVVSIEDAGIHTGRTQWLRIDYRFVGPAGERWTGHSFVPEPTEWAPGSPVRVEYVPEAPETNRLQGGRRTPGGNIPTLLFNLMFLPGVALLLLWLRAVMATRVLLTHGRLTLARIEGSERVFGVNPAQLKVRFTFRDAGEGNHEDSTWVGARTPLGRRIEQGTTSVPVIHLEGDPTRCRLAWPADFRDDPQP